MTLSSQLLATDPSLRRAPMPIDAPPVGPARARRIRLLQLRERLGGPEAEVDVEAVAAVIARRARFTRDLAVRLAAE